MIPFHRALIAALSLPLLSAGTAPEMPAYYPVCASPQRIGPVTKIGSNISGGVALAWNGTDFGTVVSDAGTLKFQRIFADGTPAGAAVNVGPVNTGGSIPTPQLLWTGAGYAASWFAYDSATAKFVVYFALLNAQGGVISGPTRISNYGTTPFSNATEHVMGFESSYGTYMVAWRDDRNYPTNLNDIYFTLLNSDGTINAADQPGSSTAADEASPAIFSRSGYHHILWIDYTSNSLRRTTFFYSTPLGGAGVALVTTGQPREPSVDPSGPSGALLWSAGDGEIRFSRLNGSGNLLGATTIVSSDAPYSRASRAVWTGAEYGVVWMNQDFTNGHELMFRRVADDSTPLGSPLLLYRNDASNYLYPSAAFGRRGFGVGMNPGFMALGCNADSTAPSCPGGFAAWSITGTSASIGWLPSSDEETDLAYYNVYRNSQWIGRTAETYYNDGGLSLSGTYGYAVQPVNAAQLQNTGCQSTFYVKTNSSLTLTMNKATANDAGLDWTDAGFNNYNIFRGTSPQVMSQIGATPELSSTDPNVLASPVSYFYSVDNPGP